MSRLCVGQMGIHLLIHLNMYVYIYIYVCGELNDLQGNYNNLDDRYGWWDHDVKVRYQC